MRQSANFLLTLLAAVILLLGSQSLSALAAGRSPGLDDDSGELTVAFRETRIPVLLDAPDNTIFQMRVESDGSDVIDSMSFEFTGGTDLDQVESLSLYYMGVEAPQLDGTVRFSPVREVNPHPSYSLLIGSVSPKKASHCFEVGKKLFPGVNYFRLGLKMKPGASLEAKVGLSVDGVSANGKPAFLQAATQEGIVHRMALALRNAGDDGSAAYRIPGLVTTNKGTLLAVYDVRYNNSKDLQEHIDIGLSRSTDGGRTWEPMRFPLSFGEWGGLPKAQNGVGDPAILVDTKTNAVWVVAWWTHGMGNAAGWTNSRPGLQPQATGQLVMSRSVDDGQTWSEPVNITSMVKKPEWPLLLQGPGRGITTEDGTLVFPIQYKTPDGIPNAGLMHSKDRGETWTITNHARTNTTESQVAQLPDGSLMLNMRDNRGGSRAVSITNDLGLTWEEHPSNRSALPEPVCMASLISVKAEDNALGRDLLIFSNPDSDKSRDRMTIKVSLDGGLSWPTDQQLMLDEGEGWGYSCLTMIDSETVGILYEGSLAHMTFQAVKLRDIVGR